MIRLACLSLFVATSAQAADARLCERFTKAFDKAGKVVGKAPDAETLGFMKKQCLKRPDAEVAKDAACLEKAKTEEAVGDCMSK